MLELLITRFSSSHESTLGLIHELEPTPYTLLGYTLEDGHRDVKVRGETRIPEGRYHLVPREVGRLHQIYSERWSWHGPMIEIADVPDFTWVMFHCGNTHGDTAGCPLVGGSQSAEFDGGGVVGRSRASYRRFYQHVFPYVEYGEAWVRFLDLDREREVAE